MVSGDNMFCLGTMRTQLPVSCDTIHTGFFSTFIVTRVYDGHFVNSFQIYIRRKYDILNEFSYFFGNTTQFGGIQDKIFANICLFLREWRGLYNR